MPVGVPTGSESSSTTATVIEPPTVMHRPVCSPGPPARARLAVIRDSQISAWFDLIRGFAAVAVFLGHARNLYFVDYQELQAPGIASRLFYLLTGAGHSWVMVFFVLSGYFVGSTVIRQFDQNRWSWTDYAVNRLSRLYVVVLPGLLLTVALDTCGRLSTGSELYAGVGPQRVIPDIAHSSGPAAFAGNLAFLQTIVVLPYGSNGPLWSLANEFWYYLIFPVLMVALRGTGPGRRIAHVALALVIGCFVWPVISHFPIWLFGALVATSREQRFMASRGIRWSLLFLSTAACIAAFAAARFKFVRNDLAADFSVGLSFAALMWTALQFPQRPARSTAARAATRLAGMSFSLYVVHLPIVALCVAVAGLNERYLPSPASAAGFLGLTAGVFALAWAFAMLTERHTDAVRRSILKLVAR